MRIAYLDRTVEYRCLPFQLLHVPSQSKIRDFGEIENRGMGLDRQPCLDDFVPKCGWYSRIDMRNQSHFFF